MAAGATGACRPSRWTRAERDDLKAFLGSLTERRPRSARRAAGNPVRLRFVERYSPFYRGAFALVALARAGLSAAADRSRPLAGALMAATVLAFLLYPVQVRLSRALKHRRELSAGLITVLTPFVIIAPLSMLALVFARQVGNLITSFKQGTLSYVPGLSGDLASYPVIGRWCAWCSRACRSAPSRCRTGPRRPRTPRCRRPPP